jgi:EAL domain-containing protein (putative c-di-GMP-specific phosphodiesterase class I)
MSPKSRLYNLVMAWKNKPFREVCDIEKPHWELTESKPLPSDNPGQTALTQHTYRGIHFEPIFNRSGSALKGVLYRPLASAADSEILRYCMEGIDALHYWQCSNRIIPLILPIRSSAITLEYCLDGLCDLILNSRLPIGLINVGLIHHDDADADLIRAITKLRRLGVLFHLLHFDGNPSAIKLVSEFQFEAVHIQANLLREKDNQCKSQLIDQINLFKKWGCKTYFSHVTFVHDNEVAYQLAIDYCYGSLMLTPVNRHQIIHIQDSRIGKALFSTHPSKKFNPEGDL